MLSDRAIDSDKLERFLLEVESDLGLASSLKKIGLSIEQYALKLSLKGTISYVEDINGRIISAVIGYSHDTPDEGSYVTQVATIRDYRGCGIAKKLMIEYLNFINETGLKYVWLTTQASNINAQKLYESVGFECTKIFTNPLTGSEMIRYELHFGEK